MTTADIIRICRTKRNKLNKRKVRFPVKSEEREFLKDVMYVLSLAIKELEYYDRVTCVECGKKFKRKEIIIQGDVNICDDCLCPE